MKVNMQKVYRTQEDFRTYSMQNEKRIKQLKKLYSPHKKFFGKKILDIGCGGGILGFILEEKGHTYTGVDVNPDMLNNAKRYATEINSKNKFVKVNLIEKKIKGTFDTISFVGNALTHITTHEFLKMLENIEKNTHKGTYFIIDYRDVVKLLAEKQWKSKVVETHTGKKRITKTTGFDLKKGEILLTSFEETGKNKINLNHTIWSPFIIEPIMNAKGWKLVKRSKTKTWQGWIDVYKR